MSFDVSIIKQNTRVALPTDDGYLFRLGVALYAFNSINSFMIEITTHIDPDANRTELHELTSGKVLDRFRSAAKHWSGADISGPASRAASEFERLNTERSDFVHSYPITNKANEQILHRRIDAKKKYFEVTNSFWMTLRPGYVMYRKLYMKFVQ
ncbi:hypothetical protein [Glutamicibacter sp. PS]|uniref:hypothetical protein n=1 Tax=Glutamicibacter sp. PS TaxID=3075634 RepID=UPI002840EE56|nr:hypothetical protein [Glutamicibacter sp. PS]MDR4532251.1 hypothetical protein [Glutamicibacter sp. PS]